jgi:uncharacterized protein DUF6121
MSEAPPPRSDPPEPPKPNPALAPTFATAGFLAGLIALWGFTSLLTDRDVIDYPDAGPLVGPAMAAAACVVVFLLSLRARITQPALLALVTGLVAYVAMVLVGGVGYALRVDSFSVLWAAVVHFGIAPFFLGGGILAGLVVGATAWLVRPRYPRS